MGMVRDHLQENRYSVEHLERVLCDNSKKYWRYPEKIDEQNIKFVQIIPCNLICAWNMTATKSVLELDNWEVVEGLFQAMYNK